MTKEAGGNVDSYVFRVGPTSVEVIHEEDGEFRSEQYLEPATAWGLWVSLQSVGFNCLGRHNPSFSPKPDAHAMAYVAATDPTTVGIVFGLVATVVFWVCTGVVIVAATL